MNASSAGAAAKLLAVKFVTSVILACLHLLSFGKSGFFCKLICQPNIYLAYISMAMTPTAACLVIGLLMCVNQVSIGLVVFDQKIWHHSYFVTILCQGTYLVSMSALTCVFLLS